MTNSVVAYDGSRFGLTGGSNASQNTFVDDFHLGGLSYEGNYSEGIATPTSLRPSSDTNLELPTGSAHMVLREIGKLGNRTDGLYPPAGNVEKTMTDWLTLHIGHMEYLHPSVCIGIEIPIIGKCEGYRVSSTIPAPVPGLWLNFSGAITMPPHWYKPTDSSLVRIFQAEAPLIQSKMTDLYTRSPRDTRTIWAMGNEPNLMEQITPEQYAAMYANYWRFIKGIDPGAKVAFGEVFLSEFFEQHEEAITILSRKVVDARRDALLSTPTTSWLRTFFTTANIGGLVERVGLDFVVSKVNEALTHRLWDVSGEEYLKRALAALPPDVIPDYLSFHVYPFSVSDQPWSHWQSKLQSFMDSTQARYTAKFGVPAKFLVTEFGNINPNLNATPIAIADQMEHMVAYLESRNDAYGWWWFEPVGQDENLKKVLPEAPMSRLYKSEANIIIMPYGCIDLSAIGIRVASMYWPAFCGTTTPTNPSNPVAPQISLPSFWGSTSPLSLVTAPSSTGSPSLLSSGSGYRTLTSLPLGATDRALVTSRLAVDVYLPLNLPNPDWKGNLALSASSPSTGLWNSWLGQVDFAAFAAGNFSTAIFPLDSFQRSSLRNGGDDLQLTLALNAPSDVVLDNVRFLPEGSAAPTFPSTRLTSRTLAAQSESDWSVSTGLLTTVTENGQTHLQVQSSGYGVVTSGWLNRDDLTGAPAQVQLQYRIATPSPLPSWPGEVGIFVNAPARGIYHAWVGSQSLQGKPYGQWNTLAFSIPTTIAQALSASGSEFQIQIVLNFPQSGLKFEWKNVEVTP